MDSAGLCIPESPPRREPGLGLCLALQQEHPERGSWLHTPDPVLLEPMLLLPRLPDMRAGLLSLASASSTCHAV